MVTWGAKFRDEVIPLCRLHVERMTDRNPDGNLALFKEFEEVFIKHIFFHYFIALSIDVSTIDRNQEMAIVSHIKRNFRS